MRRHAIPGFWLWQAPTRESPEEAGGLAASIWGYTTTSVPFDRPPIVAGSPEWTRQTWRIRGESLRVPPRARTSDSIALGRPSPVRSGRGKLRAGAPRDASPGGRPSARLLQVDVEVADLAVVVELVDRQ